MDPREPLPISLAKESIEAMSTPSYGKPCERPSSCLLPPGSVLPTETGSLSVEHEGEYVGVMR